MDYTKFNTQQYASATRTYDEGLRAYMISVYKNMTMALGVTGIVSFLTLSSETLMMALFNSPLAWVVAFAPLIMVYVLASRIHSMSVEGARFAFWGYAALMGLALAPIFLIYTGESVARVFFITASVYGSMSIYGYTTKRDLSGMHSFLMMGLIGILVASLVNIFLGSSMIQFITSVIGVLIFIGLTAYDTQRIKNTYYMLGGNAELAAKVSIYGALSLYMDFINLFIFLLQLFGNRQR